MKRIILLALFFGSLHALGQDSTEKQEPKVDSKTYEITELSKTASSEKYGFTGEFPIKVGKGKNGGPSNQRAYLSLLRDGQGKPVKFTRVGGGCCPYKSANALFGDYALVDTYEVKYKDEKGKSKKTILYISFYDYEEPMIPVGFSVDSKK